MGFLRYIGIGAYLLITYYLFPQLFILGMLLVVIYIAYRITKKIRYWSIPRGRRIKHGMLKGYMQEKYGKDEGVRCYKETVKELNRKGYR